MPYFTDERSEGQQSGTWNPDGIEADLDGTRLPCVQLQTMIDLGAAELDPAISTASHIKFSQPIDVKQWRRVEWTSCAKLRVLGLTHRLGSDSASDHHSTLRGDRWTVTAEGALSRHQ